MVDKDKIHTLLDTYFRVYGAVEIMADGGVNVDGNVTLFKAPPNGMIPVKFGIVDGVFRADHKGLISLRNCPDSCGEIYVNSNKLTSLEYCPSYLNILSVNHNRLTSLQHVGEEIAQLNASGNPLTSLVGLSEHADTPYTVDITYDAHLPLLRLVYAEKVHVGHPGGGYMGLSPYEPVNSIINKYTGQGKAGALKCAAELIRAGFKENARW